jgi:hypothetical protein
MSGADEILLQCLDPKMRLPMQRRNDIEQAAAQRRYQANLAQGNEKRPNINPNTMRSPIMGDNYVDADRPYGHGKVEGGFPLGILTTLAPILAPMIGPVVETAIDTVRGLFGRHTGSGLISMHGDGTMVAVPSGTFGRGEPKLRHLYEKYGDSDNEVYKHGGPHFWRSVYDMSHGHIQDEMQRLGLPINQITDVAKAALYRQLPQSFHKFVMAKSAKEPDKPFEVENVVKPVMEWTLGKILEGEPQQAIESKMGEINEHLAKMVGKHGEAPDGSGIMLKMHGDGFLDTIKAFARKVIGKVFPPLASAATSILTKKMGMSSENSRKAQEMVGSLAGSASEAIEEGLAPKQAPMSNAQPFVPAKGKSQEDVVNGTPPPVQRGSGFAERMAKARAAKAAKRGTKAPKGSGKNERSFTIRLI